MNFKQQSFITEYLRHRSAFTAYCLAYNVKDESKFESIMSAANRLLNDPKIGGLIDSVLSGIRQDVEQEIRAKLRTDLLTTQRKRELLAKIATGEMYAVQVYKGKDCTQCTQHVWPTINQMLKAIDLDNKMVGQYATTRVGDKPKSVPALNEQIAEQVDKFLKSLGLATEQLSEAISLQPSKETSISQQLSEAISLQASKETSISKQNTTNQVETPLLTKEGTMENADSIFHCGEVDSRSTDNTPEIPTKGNKNITDVTHRGVDKETENNMDEAPSGGGVNRQQSATIQGSPFRGLG